MKRINVKAHSRKMPAKRKSKGKAKSTAKKAKKQLKMFSGGS